MDEVRKESRLPTLLGLKTDGRPVRREPPPALPVRPRPELPHTSHGPLLAALAAQWLATREDLHRVLLARPQVIISKPCAECEASFLTVMSHSSLLEGTTPRRSNHFFRLAAASSVLATRASLSRPQFGVPSIPMYKRNCKFVVMFLNENLCSFLHRCLDVSACRHPILIRLRNAKTNKKSRNKTKRFQAHRQNAGPNAPRLGPTSKGARRNSFLRRKIRLARVGLRSADETSPQGHRRSKGTPFVTLFPCRAEQYTRSAAL